MKKLSLHKTITIGCAVVALAVLAACGKKESYETPLPTKEKTVDRAQQTLDKAAQTAQEKLEQAEKENQK